MQELQGRVERLQHKNDQKRAQIEKSRELGRDVQDGNRSKYPIAHNKGKEPIIPDNVDAPADDELSLGISLSMSPPLGRNTRGNTSAKSRWKHSHRPAFSDVVNGASSRARRETNRKQNQSKQPLGKASMLPSGIIPPMSLLHPAFGIGPTIYMSLAPLIRDPTTCSLRL